MKSIFYLFLLLFFGFQTAYSQQKNDTIPYNTFPISGTKLHVQIPNNYTIQSNNTNEFSCSEKGIVLTYIYIPNVTVKQFCDSLTPAYFEKQNLHNIQIRKSLGVSIYTGNFTINDIVYTRAFYVCPYKHSTFLALCNYPQIYADETEQIILKSFSTIIHD